MMRPTLLLALAPALLAACGLLGPLKDPFRSLTPGGACTQDAQCAIGSCPNACNQGQPTCQFPTVYRLAEVEQACPCVKMPNASECAAPAPDACGPQPGCIAPEGADTVQARCVSGQCAARFPDGGVVPDPVP